MCLIKTVSRIYYTPKPIFQNNKINLKLYHAEIKSLFP